MRRLPLSAALFLCFASLPPVVAVEREDPIADPAAIVLLSKNARLTLLTPTLLRFEVSSTGDFDDRATFSVVNRRLPVPAFSVAHINASTTVVTTAAMTVMFSGGNGTQSTCAATHPETDATEPHRSASFPNGLNASSVAECCAACDSDPTCSSWVFAPQEHMCWPLEAASGTSAATGRIFGGSLPPSLSVTFVGPAGAPVTWTPGAVDASNLNGTYTALDCYSTPMECASEYYGRMRSGLLSTSGWTALSDTGIARFVPAPDAPAGLPHWWSLNQTDKLDVYFQANGDLNYRAALAEWAAILGAASMLPRSAFGVWWSRYYPYSDATFVDEVLTGYANNSIPLNNVVFDMVRSQWTSLACSSQRVRGTNCTSLCPPTSPPSPRSHGTHQRPLRIGTTSLQILRARSGGALMPRLVPQAHCTPLPPHPHPGAPLQQLGRQHKTVSRHGHVRSGPP